MKRVIAIATVVLGLAAQPVAAQQAPTLDDDLVCIAWTAQHSNNVTDDGQKKALTNLMFYYVGRWEGATGRSIDTGLTVAFVTANFTKINAAADSCLKRGGDMANGLMVAGKRLQDAGSGK